MKGKTRKEAAGQSHKKERVLAFKKRKISASAVAKWKQISPQNKSAVSWMLREAFEKLAGNGNEAVQLTLNKIQRRMDQKLKTLVVPQEQIVDQKNIDARTAALQSELESLQEEEESYRRKIQKCQRKISAAQKDL